jgi:phenylacetate-CoA ligase
MSGQLINLDQYEFDNHDYVRLEAKEEQVYAIQHLKMLLSRLEKSSPFYQRKLNQAGLTASDFESLEDLEHFPLTTKEELREAYPLGLQTVPDRDVVRIHSSSGTTGKPIIIPYTAQDVADWATMMARGYAMMGVNREDRVQITPGYGLWTAGIGFQAGVERLGAMAVPMGPGNTDKQFQMMIDLKSTVLIATSSYALLLAEEAEKRGLKEHIHLRKGIFGSERWSDRMRTRIENELGITTYDIYGLTEIYGPGIAVDCDCHEGLHYWSDYLYFEVIDPISGKRLPDGEQGELVITTLMKEGAPLLRYRTRDLTSILPGRCDCGSPYPRIQRVSGRSDDMIKIKGVNIYPGQIDDVLKKSPGVSSEYQVRLTRFEGRDNMLLRVEGDPGTEYDLVQSVLAANFKKLIGVAIDVEVLPIGGLPRSEKKSKRVLDERDM